MLVSRLERDFVFSPRSIVEHGQVIAKIFESRTVLPMRFGTFFRSEQQVINLVRENRQDLLEAFCRLRGKAEMRVKLLLGFGVPPVSPTGSKTAEAIAALRGFRSACRRRAARSRMPRAGGAVVGPAE